MVNKMIEPISKMTKFIGSIQVFGMIMLIIIYIDSGIKKEYFLCFLIFIMIFIVFISFCLMMIVDLLFYLIKLKEKEMSKGGSQ